MERWNLAYREAPEIFDAFTRAEDPDGRVVASLLARASLDGRSVLEIGCGTGRYTRELAPNAGCYLALERSPQMLRLALAGPRDAAPHPWFVCARAERMPLRPRSMEQVIAGWVLVNLRPAARAAVLHEIDRVLRPGPGSATWLIENHWSGEFQELRERRREEDRARVLRLIDDEGFELVEIVETELRFPSSTACRQVLGYLCGDAVDARLRRRPTRCLTHNVIILCRPARR